MELVIYTDGASTGSGKPEGYSGWSCIFNVDNKTFIRYGYQKAPSTNNRGEIFGVLYATYLLHRHRSRYEKITIISDSQYVVKSCMEWRHKWKNQGYLGVKNDDLLVPLFGMLDIHGNILVKWVKGHNGDPGNELADEYAVHGKKNTLIEKESDRHSIKKLDSDYILREIQQYAGNNFRKS